MKTYCTQNQGDCSTCSLVNYGKDCLNNPVEGKTVKKSFMVCPDCLAFDDDLNDTDAGDTICEEGRIKPMTREEFFRTISKKIIDELL
jgi:hypothetical protein